MSFDSDSDFAAERDAADPLARFREHFEIPTDASGRPQTYLCGHSLGLMPATARAAIARELDRWSGLAVAGHFDTDGWFAYHERFAEPLAALLGAEPPEVVAMNSLTTNLHLMLVSFFRPDGDRCQILIESDAFPSDRYAVHSQLRWHGLEPDRDLIELAADPNDGISAEALDRKLTEASGRVALVLLPGVQYLSGEAVDLAACTEVAHRHGCRIGFDLAHAVGNLELNLRHAAPDFAIWCSYKYLNGGPGAIGGCYINQRWLTQSELPRFEGWWGHDKQRRFEPTGRFSGMPTAEAWQLSNPPILAMAPLAASLEIFSAAGIDALRSKSVELTGYLEYLLTERCQDEVEILTPSEPERRGAQLSLRLHRAGDRLDQIVEGLGRDGVVVDHRAPDILRLAPVPLYNTFADVHAGVAALERQLRD